jgi:hypothetical protein
MQTFCTPSGNQNLQVPDLQTIHQRRDLVKARCKNMRRLLPIIAAVMAVFLATMTISAAVPAYATCHPVSDPASCTGAQGNQGPAGPAGPQGDVGPAGPAGIDGINGIDGKDGKDGTNGIDGKNFDNAELQRGLATVAALTVPHIDVGKKFGVSASTGFYGERSAIGLGLGLRFNENWQVGGSFATDTDGRNVTGKVAATAQW